VGSAYSTEVELPTGACSPVLTHSAICLLNNASPAHPYLNLGLCAQEEAVHLKQVGIFIIMSTRLLM
jgi:hypothetical protein